MIAIIAALSLPVHYGYAEDPLPSLVFLEFIGMSDELDTIGIDTGASSAPDGGAADPSKTPETDDNPNTGNEKTGHNTHEPSTSDETHART